MKQAILIMAHKNRAQLERLIRYFDGQCDIIIHLDKSSPFNDEDIKLLEQLPGVKKVFRKIAVHWGGFTLLRCQLFLLEMGLKYSDCRYIHLLSGEDYPLKPLDDFLRFFELETREFIEGAHLPAPHWDGNTYKRIQHYFFTDWLRPKNDDEVQRIWDFATKQDKWKIRRRIPDQVKHLYGGSAWFSLTRTCTEKVVEYSHKHPSLLRRFRFTFAPDEIYIHTVVRHVEFENKEMAGGNLRFIHWAKGGDNHPVCFDESHFHDLSSFGAFFARKFEVPHCDKVLDLIDRYMLTQEKVTFSATGAWETKTLAGHFYDQGLCRSIIRICKICHIRNVIDFGCGPGWYVTALRKANIAAVGYDGNPHTEEFSRLLEGENDYPCCGQVELTEEIEVEEPYDMALCLSVGEYIPRQYEEQLWRNLIGSTSKFLILGWGTTDLCEEGVINAHTEMETRKKAECYGLKVNELATRMLRAHSTRTRYKNTVLVLEKYVSSG